MSASDKELMEQYRERQKIEQAKAKLNSNRIYQKIKEDINNDESAPFEHIILMDDSLEDIDVTAHRFNIDYDIIHKDYCYRVIFRPYHQYQSKRYQQMQQFINQDLREKEDWLNTMSLASVICTFAFFMIGIILMHYHTLLSTFLLIISGLIFIGILVKWRRIDAESKKISATLPAKASDVKL